MQNEPTQDYSNFLNDLLIRVVGSNQFIRPNTRWCIAEPIDKQNIRLKLTFDFSYDRVVVRINMKTLKVDLESFTEGRLQNPYKAEIYYQSKRIAIIEKTETITETETKPTPEGKWLTYYTPAWGSFNVISKHHVRLLPSFGWNIHLGSLDSLIHHNITASNDEWGLIHPTFYVFQANRKAIYHLGLTHTYIGGFDLADTTRLSKFAVRMANKMDLLFVPSKYSKKAYIRSGVKTRVEVVPHGVDEKLYSQPKTPLTLFPEDKTKILFFYLHSELRKGADVVRTVMKKLMKERNDLHLVVKSTQQNVLGDLPNTSYITGWISDEDIVHLYDSCDILLAPSRGGGFELNVLEALARGLVVITSEWGAIQEYAKPYVLTIKSTHRRIHPLPNNPIHVGYGVDPDPDSCYNLLTYAIENLDTLKKKAKRNAPRIRKKFSWSNAVRRISECLNSMSE